MKRDLKNIEALIFSRSEIIAQGKPIGCTTHHFCACPHSLNVKVLS